jgi:hypothetical protein
MPAKETPNCPVRANIISTGLFCHFDHREKSSLFLFAASRYSKKNTCSALLPPAESAHNQFL